MWQDYVLAVGNWIFVAALIPAILHPTDKPPIASSVITAAVLFVFSYVFLTLNLKSSALSALVLGLTWHFIAYQKWVINRNRSP